MTSLQFIKWICIYKPATLKSIVGIFLFSCSGDNKIMVKRQYFLVEIAHNLVYFSYEFLVLWPVYISRDQSFKGFSDMNLAEASLSLDAESHLASSSSVAAPGVKYPYIPPYGLRVPVQRPTRLHQL